MTITEIKEMADKEYEPFLNMIHANYPELLLKYNINNDMKPDFIEAVLRQVWVQKEYNKVDILEFMSSRG